MPAHTSPWRGAVHGDWNADMDFHAPVSTDYPEHPKTLHLIRLAGARADCFPTRMWTWACRFRKSGVFVNAMEVEQACRWDGDPGILHQALVAAGFLEADGLTIHDWKKHAGAWLERYEDKRQKDRARLASQRHRSDIAAISRPVGESRVGDGSGEEGSAINDAPSSLREEKTEDPRARARGNSVPSGDRRIPNVEETAKKLAEDRRRADAEFARRQKLTPEQRAVEDAPLRKFAR